MSAQVHPFRVYLLHGALNQLYNSSYTYTITQVDKLGIVPHAHV